MYINILYVCINLRIAGYQLPFPRSPRHARTKKIKKILPSKNGNYIRMIREGNYPSLRTLGGREGGLRNRERERKISEFRGGGYEKTDS